MVASGLLCLLEDVFAMADIEYGNRRFATTVANVKLKVNANQIMQIVCVKIQMASMHSGDCY